MIKTTDIVDPIINDPIRIVGVDWDANTGTLDIKLNQPVNKTWIHALCNMGNHTSLYLKGPENFHFIRGMASVPATSNEVQQIVNYFKDWLPQANRKYEAILRAETEKKEREERDALQMQKKREEERLNVLKNLKY